MDQKEIEVEYIQWICKAEVRRQLKTINVI